MEAVRRMVGPLQARVMLMLGRAILKAVKDDAPSQLVQAALLGDEVRDGVERLAEYGFTSVPHPGAQAVAVFVGGERGHGIVIATGDRRYRLKGLADGEVAIYDDVGQKVHLTRNGIIVDGGGLPIKIENTPLVTIDSDLHVTKSIVADLDISDHGNKSMAGMREVYNNHDHADPQGGKVLKPAQGM